MELGVRQFRGHEQFNGIPRNSMKQGVHQLSLHQQFHGSPRSAPISMTQAVPWNTMQLGMRQFR